MDKEEESFELRRISEVWNRISETVPQQCRYSSEEIGRITTGRYTSQFDRRRQADRWLLASCLLLLAVFVFAFDRISCPWAYAVLLAGLLTLWVAAQAGLSLFYLRQTYRLRFRPSRMERYTVRLNRLSDRRHRWLDFVLYGQPMLQMPPNRHLAANIQNYQIPIIAATAMAVVIILVTPALGDSHIILVGSFTTRTDINNTINQMLSAL